MSVTESPGSIEGAAAEVVRSYFSFAGSSFDEFIDHNRKLVDSNVIWIDHGNPDGVRGLDGLIAEFERVHALGVGFLTFDVLSLATDGDLIFTKRLDYVRADDGSVITTLDILGINKVADGKIVYGKDHYFQTEGYQAAWYGAPDGAPSPEEVVRGYYATSGPTFANFESDSRRWLADDVVWVDRANPDGVRGKAALLDELRRAHSLGIEYMSFDIHELAVIGDTVLTRRNDRLHDRDGNVIADLDMMGYNIVKAGKIQYGKDYHFETAAYDATWGGRPDG